MSNTIKVSSWKQRLLVSALAFGYCTLGIAPVYASDTEVYSRVEVIDSADANPVMMMLLDSSALMRACVTTASTSTGPTPACAVASNARIEIMKRAMRRVLFGNPVEVPANTAVTPAIPAVPVIKPAPGFVNLGYGRFIPEGNKGAWIRYPARKLDSLVYNSDTTGSFQGFEEAELQPQITVSGSDAQAVVAGVSTALNITATTATVGHSNPEVFLRFQDLYVPRGAVIDDAKLILTPSASGSGQEPDVFVAVENTGDAALYPAAGWPAAGAGSRSFVSETAPVFSILSSGSAETAYVLPVKDQLQVAVDKSSWCGGNAVSLRIRSAASNRVRTFQTLDGSVAGAPRLYVKYTLKAGTHSLGGSISDTCVKIPIHTVQLASRIYDDVEWHAGNSSAIPTGAKMRVGEISAADGKRLAAVRFQNIDIKQGSTVQEAWLYSTAAAVADADTRTPLIRAQTLGMDHVPAFCARATPSDPLVCTPPDTSLLTPVALSALDPAYMDGRFTMGLINDGSHFAAKVNDQVQAVINRPGWLPGKAIGFVLQNDSDLIADSSNRAISAADNGASKGLVLHVKALQTFTDLSNGLPRTVREDIVQDMERIMIPDGDTPFGDGFQEVGRYLLGKLNKSEQSPVAVNGVDYRVPDKRVVTKDASGNPTATYQSPISSTDQCSANYIFAMTSGETKNANGVTTKSNDLTGTGFACAIPSGVMNATEKSTFDGMCQVATYLATKDPSRPFIRTNTVQFNGTPSATISYGMQLVANKGGQGKYYQATDEASLVNALTGTVESTVDEVGSITAPGVAVNQFNRLTHLDQLYYAVFDPDTGRKRWRGNVKRYRLVFPDATTVEIRGADNRNAVDPNTTFFSKDAYSYWFSSPLSSEDKDGNLVSSGGVARWLPVPTNRSLFTNPAGDTTLQKINDAAFPITTVRTSMGLTADNQFKNVRDWLLGYQVNIVNTSVTPNVINSTYTDPAPTVSNPNPALRGEIGGVLHSQPVLINFGFTGAADVAALDPNQQKNYVFFSTLEGLLHVVNANTGVEKFAFMPKETLSLAPDLIINSKPTDGNPLFGMDLTWTSWRVDANKDMQIRRADGDKVYVFGGMRMGGSSYYALDVTDIDTGSGGAAAPVLKWVISPARTGYADLGETWSKPVMGKVRFGGAVKDVLFFAGGYDRLHEDTAYLPTSDTKGRKIYIVDPETGALLWTSSAALPGNDKLTFSIPSELKLFDANKDGLVDAVYFGDLGGQVFRLDLNNNAASESDLGVRLHLLAKVGQTAGTANTTNQRRFYEPPGVATLLDASNHEYVVVAMGSGYRSRPLNKDVEDAFYVFKDRDVLNPNLATLASSSLQPTITPTELASVNLGVNTGAANVADMMGWMVDFPDTGTGEKVLASPIILFGEVFFSTYIPKVTGASACSPVIGASNLWRMSVTDGSALTDTNGDGSVTKEDRISADIVMGLGGAPQLIVLEDGKNAILAGTGADRNKDLGGAGLRRTRWYEKK